MRVVFLVVALLLIAASVIAFVWIRPPVAAGPGLERVWVSGRVTGSFPDHPWAGTVVYLGSEHAVLTQDGRFSFAALPGTHILTVCCSARFQHIYKEVTVTDRRLEIELVAQPLKEIPGRLVIRGGEELASGFIISARHLESNVVDRAVTSLDGTFALHVMEGDWQVAVENLPDGYALRSITLGEHKLRERTLTIGRIDDPSLPLQITLQ
jgi:hypothetical protein